MAMGNEQFQTPEDDFAAAPASFDTPNEQPEQPQAQAETPEPFDGFGALPESVRQKWLEADEQRKKYETDLAQARREVSALKGKVPYLERELSKFRKEKPAQAASASPSGSAMSAEAWEKFKAQWPDDAKAFEEALARQAGEITGKLSPLEQQLKELAERTERFEQMAAQAENEAIQESLDEAVPDWRIIAGWETADGQEGDKQWHPEFQAWLDSMPSRARAQADELLSSRDPEDIASVFHSFKRDYYLLLLEEESAPPQQTRPRLAATRDVMPSSPGNGLGTTSRGGTVNQAEEAYVAAVSSDFAKQWMNAKVG